MSDAGADMLLEAAIGYLKDVAAPGLPGQAGFHARVAANTLAIVRREMELGEAAREAELEGLERLTGQTGDPQALRAALCEQIAEGEIGLSSPGLLEHLRETAMVRLRIDQPRYSGLRHLEAL